MRQLEIMYIHTLTKLFKNLGRYNSNIERKLDREDKRTSYTLHIYLQLYLDLKKNCEGMSIFKI